MEEPETMAAFFDARAAGYDDHMRDTVFEGGNALSQFYRAVSSPIGQTDEPIRILDLGCGTGLEIEAVLRRAPNARIIGFDLSRSMLALLRQRCMAHMSQITLVRGSYLAVPFGTRAYDHIISAMAAHHLLPDAKRRLYKRIHAALRPAGTYIEGVNRPGLSGGSFV